MESYKSKRKEEVLRADLMAELNQQLFIWKMKQIAKNLDDAVDLLKEIDEFLATQKEGETITKLRNKISKICNI